MKEKIINLIDSIEENRKLELILFFIEKIIKKKDFN